MREPILLLTVAASILSACATPGTGASPASAGPATLPAADRIARLPPFDRGAVEFQGELLRLAAVPEQPMTAPSGRAMRMRGMADALGPTVVAIQDASGTPTYTYVGPLLAYRNGALARNANLRAALTQARAASAFHQPVRTRFGSGDVSCVLDKVPKAAGVAPGFRLTLTLSDGASAEATAPKADAAPARRLKPGGRVSKKAAVEQELAAKLAAVAGAPFATLELVAQEVPGGGPRGSLGLGLEAPSPVANKARGLPLQARGALVAAVSPGGPAERAGIQPGDLVQALDGQAIASPDALVSALASLAAFTPATVTLQRGLDHLAVPVTLGHRATYDRIIRHAGNVVAAGDAWLDPDGRLAAVSFPPWRPAPEFFLAGKTSKDLWQEHDRATEQAINDTVVDWKTRQLPNWLRQASAEQLENTIVTTEKGILALDLAVRSVKDQIDAAARKDEGAFAGAGDVEQLLEQRKMLLGVVLQAVKSAAAQRAPGS